MEPVQVPTRSRTAKSLEALLEDKRKHMTRSEVEFRARAEAAIKSNCKAYVMSTAVKADRFAASKFKELILLYAENPYVERMDSDLMNEYCLLCSEMRTMRERHRRLNFKADQALRGKLMLAGGKPCDSVTAIIFVKAVASLEQDLLRARPQLLQMMDRLLLTPAGRIKAVPKTPPKDERPKVIGEELFS